MITTVQLIFCLVFKCVSVPMEDERKNISTSVLLHTAEYIVRCI